MAKRVLIDTNILIHRETKNPIEQQIGTLFFWLDKLNFDIWIHPVTKEEILRNKNSKAIKSFLIKMDEYRILRVSKKLHENVELVSNKIDSNGNDLNDTKILNEVYCDRVQILISEDVKIHKKALELGIESKVYTIKSFLNFVREQTPGLVNYDILEIRKKYFSEINLDDSFFDSLKEDYKPEFEKWFLKKYSGGEQAYVLKGVKGNIEAFLYLKIETEEENYFEISPPLLPAKRLKVGTLKVTQTGMRLGERFFKIIFDNAKENNVDEIYVTIFNDSNEKDRLVEMLLQWGFNFYGIKGKKERVYVRAFSKKILKKVNVREPKKTYPYISQSANYYMIPIRPIYHTDLFPDSIIRGENKEDFFDGSPHRNAISKAYLTSAKERNLKSGDGLIFYRTGGRHKGVATTVGIVEDIDVDIKSDVELVEKTRKKTVFSESDLKDYFNKRKGWSKSFRPYLINFLYVGSLKKRPNLNKMMELNIVDQPPQYVSKITKEAFKKLIKDNL